MECPEFLRENNDITNISVKSWTDLANSKDINDNENEKDKEN